MKIAIATCFNIPEPDIDEAITLEAFERRGYEVHLTAWEDPSIDWSDFDGVIVRSTWNYPLSVEKFAAWIGDVDSQTTLLNPARIMLGNLNKHYLTAVKDSGVSVVPTNWIKAGDATELSDLVVSKFVLKPSVGAGSLDTKVFESNQLNEAMSWLSRHPVNREFMVQPFLDSVNNIGEQSIIVIGGNPTHRIVKLPRFAGQEERVDGPFAVGEFKGFVREVIEPIKDQILYARVDLMLDNEGIWRLSELELIEPSLFFTYCPEALEDFVNRAEFMLS
jgi:hypothetical protein